jgi:Helix-loop-helix DNA-binding domain
MNDFSFGWQELPPAFMGTTSSFGQQQLVPTNEIPNATFSNTNGPISMQPNEHSSNAAVDILAAATLLQNGHQSRPQRLGNEALFANQDLSMSAPSHTNGPNMMVYNSLRARQIPLKQDDYMRDTLYAEMMFGPSAGDGRSQAKATPSKIPDIRWGSDAGFGSGQGFVAPPGQVSIEAVEQNMMHVVECLEPQVSTASSTRPSTPIVSHHEPVQQRPTKAMTSDNDERGDDDSRPRKRRKGKTKNEGDGDDEGAVTSKAPRKRRPKSLASINPPSSSATQSPPPAKRRKSAASSATKPPRENLTEDQKRENHIKSEQKRRTLIKEGFDDLGELVPDLRGGGHSKSAVLVMAADWLEDLIRGNKLLRARLQELEQGKVL